MKSRKDYIIEPNDERWLEVTPRAAVAGGVVVVLLLAAMTLLQPEPRGAVNATRNAPALAQDTQVSILPPPVPSAAVPETASTSADDDTKSWASREDVPPSF